MAVRAVGLCKSLLKPFQSLSLNTTSIVVNQKLSQHETIQRYNHNLTLVRNASFFTKLPAEKLWKSVTSVSNAGAKKGRGRGGGAKRVKDLNKGQVIGSGPINMVWPGLSSPVIRGRELVQQQKLPEDPERLANLIKLRDSMGNFRRLKLSPSERGWSGVKMPGRKIGPPDPVANESFEGFETIVLEFKTLLTMRGGLGRTRKISCLVVTGNKKGLVGFAIGKGRMGAAALKTAKNRAGQKLITVDLYNDHTIYHDFFSMFGKTKIFGHKQAEGYGLQCHRAIKAICQVVGIKDMHAKVEGSHNLQNIIKAFFIALLQQKSHQQMAEEKGLHLVEFKKEHEFFPKVVASPSVVRTEKEISKDEVLDFTRYALDNRVMEKMKKHPPFYTKLPHWQIYLKKYEKRRNHNTIRQNMLVEHGELKSFLTDRYKDEPLVKE